MNNYEANVEQLELLSVKESNEKRVPAKRVDIVSLRLVKETSLLYKDRAILEDANRERFVVMTLDVKNQPMNIQIVQIGSLNASILR